MGAWITGSIADMGLFSRQLIWAILIAVSLLINAGCASHPLESGQKRSESSNRAKTVRVRKGDTLYGLAWKAGLDYRTLARWNGLKKPYLIYPGQIIRLYPSKPSGHKKKTGRKKTRSSTKQPKKATKRQSRKTATTKKTHNRQPAAGSLKWIWPVRGKIISTFSSKDATRDGIRIAGHKGQRVVAAESGEVVYVGSGLIGYGKLIIIKHNSKFLSAYGHNARLRVKEGQKIKKGQYISDMGETHDGRAALYFEIRKYGKPRNPLSYLPK